MISSRLSGLRNDNEHVYLRFLPQELTIFEVVQVVLVFVARQLLSIFGIGNVFTVKPAVADKDEVYLLPDLRVSMPFKVKEHDLATYASAIGFAHTSAETLLDNAGQLCLMLSAFTEPAFLLLLAHYRSPVRPLGSVNVRNKFELLRPDLCTAEALIGNGSFVVQAKLLPHTRKVRKGLEIDIEVELVDTKGPVIVFKQIFTMLQFMKFKIGSAVTKVQVKEDAWASHQSATFTTKASATMAWTSICKDYNPIHISDLAAKLFGFSRRIVHGNHAIASALYALEQGAQGFHSQPRKCSMSVNFIRPVTIPSTLEVQASTTADRMDFNLRKNGKTSMTGSITA